MFSHSTKISAILASTTPRDTYSTTDSCGKTRPKIKCDHCGKENHTIDRCYCLHSFPSKRQSAKHSQRSSYPVAVNAAQFDDAPPSQVSPAPPLSQKQYQQLLPLLTAAKRGPLRNEDCYWDYGKARCAWPEHCEYRYVFGDVHLGQSCRLKNSSADLLLHYL
ncbi:hypothetical protein HHK36_012907 [Tetracentron sinense]|uniref:Uncharacterized protein n=1 Tax=Tetracentron sinense TaxID=13715 RepID=A0A835DG48_TETSI|nr:hypothetical protein HHK36_012907 [Tetracentron sinense]